jgi:hypothetical protein
MTETAPEETTVEETTKEPIEVQTFFLVVIDKAGTPVLLTRMPEEAVVAEREANIVDVRRACLDISAEIQVRSIADVLTSILPKEEATSAEQVRDALADRGVSLDKTE